MIVIRDIPQGTEEWHALRIGSIGGSRISKAVAGGQGKTRQQLLYDMVGEMLSGQIKEGHKTVHMENGNLYEDEARTLYSFHTDSEVEQVAMIREGKHKHYSPDGLVGEDGLIEIKTVIPSTWVEFAATGSVPTDYRRQMQWGMHITLREWCDYVVYCPWIKGVFPLISVRLVRDEKEIQELDTGCNLFLREMLELYGKVKA